MKTEKEFEGYVAMTPTFIVTKGSGSVMVTTRLYGEATPARKLTEALATENRANQLNLANMPKTREIDWRENL